MGIAVKNQLLFGKYQSSSGVVRVINSLLPYGFAIFFVCLAIVLTKLVNPIIKDDAFEFFLGAILLSVYYGSDAGHGPGLLAACLSVVALDYFFIPPFNAFAFGVTEILRITVFSTVAVLIGSLSSKLKTAKFDLQHAHDVLEQRVCERAEQLLQTNAQLKDEVAQRLEAQKAILEIINREQYRLGQDLHDGLIQLLAGGRLVIEELKIKLAREGHPYSDDLKIAESYLTDALTQADTISRGLYPVELEKNGLVAALAELAEKTSRVHPVSCLFICRTAISIDDTSTAIHLYRIAQEAVSNAIKGGKAKRINIRLRLHNEKISLSIADNGIGLKKAKGRGGMGLQIMNYRARFINGDLRFSSRQSGGTMVRCFFSLKNGGTKYEK